MFRTEHDKIMSRMWNELQTHPNPSSPEYFQLLQSLKTLTEIDSEHESKHWTHNKVLVTTGGYLLGVALILVYEHAHVLTSRAMSALPSLRT